MNERKFIVTRTADFNDESGAPKFPPGLIFSILDAYPHIALHAFAEHRNSIDAAQIGDAQGVIVMSPAVTAQTVSQPDSLLVLARFGVGYDNVDVKACTAANVLVTITVGAVDRPVAEATVGWMIALGHNMRVKDGLVRAGQWNERHKYMGRELRDRTLGVIGFGRIARKTIELLRGFGMKQPLAFDPHAEPALAQSHGVRLTNLPELMAEADFISIHCPLTEETRGLIGAEELALMKPDAYLLNTARGGIVDENALYETLKKRRIAGAALDCFNEEPILTPHRFGDLDNVLLAPHSIAWTYEGFRAMGQAACQVMVDLSLGVKPQGVLNPELFARPAFQAKWKRFQT
jgi:phosphoglycerate dehydrogenase-like enzyme